MTGELEERQRRRRWQSTTGPTPQRLDAAHAMAVSNYAGKLPPHPSVPKAGCGGVRRRPRVSGGCNTAAVASTVRRDMVKLEQSRFVFSRVLCVDDIDD
jgi:hypothetical protein